ncbi:MAG: hypothetical protein U1E58_01505 [Tabrizicola sp.]
MAGAAIGGAAAAFMGLGTWKKQITWQNDSDLARRVLLSAYRYRDAVFALRNPRISGFEMVPENGRITPGQNTVAGTATAMIRRLTLLRSARTELEGVLQEVEAQWGEQFKQSFGEIFNEESKLFRAVQLFIQSLDDEAPKEDRVRLMQRMKEGGNIHFHSSAVDQDEFSKNFESLISSVSKLLRQKIGNAR